MTFLEFILVVAVVFVFGVVVLAANYADRTRSSRMALAVIGVLVLINALIVVSGILSLVSAYGPTIEDTNPPSESAAWGGLIASLFVAGLATALLYRPFRNRAVALFPRYTPERATPSATDNAAGMPPARVPQIQTSGEPLFPQMLNYYTTSSAPLVPVGNTDVSVVSHEPPVTENATYRVRGFNPASSVHLLAVVFVLYLLGSQFISFIVGGGLEGLAESYEETGIDIWTLLSNSLPLAVLPFLGVGLGIRRNLRQSLERLGLGPLTGQGLAVSFGVTFALFAGLFVIGLIWTLIVPKEMYEEQTQATEALSDSVDTIGLAFMLAATAAVGEEIAFRGALQPVIGFWPTAIVFALTHTQYALTPAWLIILIVAVAFGWIRQRYNTTVAILTHFWYNLFQLLLLFVAPEETTESFLRIIHHL